MNTDENTLGQIVEVKTVDDIAQVNIGLSMGWVILKITENITGWEDGSKSSKIIYHMGKPKSLPI